MPRHQRPWGEGVSIAIIVALLTYNMPNSGNLTYFEGGQHIIFLCLT